jgi:hypothetical protein
MFEERKEMQAEDFTEQPVILVVAAFIKDLVGR